MKRFFDFILSSLGIFLFGAPALLFSLLIKLEDGGGPFFIQDRWGRDGRKFRLYKFRTMRPDADKRWGVRPTEQNDPRVTRIGAFLRATAMDELPQLINIWKGEMSFVGPRPLGIWETDPSRSYFAERHRIRPGLTGLAQLETWRNATLEEKLPYDLAYVRGHSLWGDLGLIGRSIQVTLFGRWESLNEKEESREGSKSFEKPV